MKFVIALLLLALLLLGLRIAMPKLGTSKARGPVDIKGEMQLVDCSNTPNCQSSQASRPEQRVAALDLPGQSEPIKHIASVLVGEPGAHIVTQKENYLHVTFKSSLMNYIDDVEFLHKEGADDVHIRSASRLGTSDLGANLKRVESLRALLTK